MSESETERDQSAQELLVAAEVCVAEDNYDRAEDALLAALGSIRKERDESRDSEGRNVHALRAGGQKLSAFPYGREDDLCRGNPRSLP